MVGLLILTMDQSFQTRCVLRKYRCMFPSTRMVIDRPAFCKFLGDLTNLQLKTVFFVFSIVEAFAVQSTVTTVVSEFQSNRHLFWLCFQVIYDRMTQRSRGFAFVTMSTVQDARAAIEKLDGIVCQHDHQSLFCIKLGSLLIVLIMLSYLIVVFHLEI
jgi:hypothetical protein